MRLIAGLLGASVLLGAAWADDAPAPAGDAAPPTDSAAPPPPPPAPMPVIHGPVATMVTSMGTITIALDAEHAPVTVKNFVRYAREKHYDGSVFYRVEPGFVIQAGSYDASGKFKGGLHKPIIFEGDNGLKNVHGAIAMARVADPVSADAEFFIDLADVPGLDHTPGETANKTGYAVFGFVTGGLDVVDKIGTVKTNGGKGPFPKAAPVTPITIVKVTIADAAN